MHDLHGLNPRFSSVCFVYIFNFIILELPRTVVQPVYHGDGHYRGLSVRQTTSLLETGRTNVSSGQVVLPKTFIDRIAWTVLGEDKVDVSENKYQQVSKLSINTGVSGVIPFFSVKNNR